MLLSVHKAACLIGGRPRLDLPWTATPAQQQAVVERCKGMRVRDEVCCLPHGMTAVHFEKAFGVGGQLKSAEYLLLAGPYGKYLMQGCFHSEVQAAVFKYLDLLGLLWQKSISLDALDTLESAMLKVLAELEELLPAWELDMNRHKMIHLVKAVRTNGPCWAWAMFGFERFWKHLTDWMTQTSHPEATMFNAHFAFKATCLSLPEMEAKSLLSDRDDALLEGHGCAAPNLFYHKLCTFDRLTNELILPEFLQAQPASVKITMSDSSGIKCFGVGQHPDNFDWRAELHSFYCQFPEWCAQCSCCDKSYDELWSKFLVDTSTTKPTRAQLPNALKQWHAWANQQPDLCEHAQRLCYGPRCQVTVYDRAQIGGASFSAMTTEGKKHSRNSVVLMKDNDVYWAGRVRFFLAHTPPGYDVDEVEEASIAHVHWYKKVPSREQIDHVVGCPVFQEGFKDDPNGNMWPMEKLAPVALTVARHRKSGWVCVLNRFANFLDHVP